MRPFVAVVALCLSWTVAVAEEAPASLPASPTTPAKTAPATSDGPPPTPRELPRPDQEGPKASEQATARDQRGTDEKPLSIKLIPGEKTESEARKERYEADEKPSLDRGLTSYTGWLVVFTALLFVAASIQAGLFVWQLLLIRRSLSDSKHAADAAKSAAEAAQAAIGLERPLIVVGINKVAVVSNDGVTITAVPFTVHNWGRGIGFLTKLYIEKGVFDELPPKPDYREGRFIFDGIHAVYTPGWQATYDKQGETFTSQGEGSFYLFGYVEYADLGGKTYTSRFCNRVHPTRGTYDGSVGGEPWNRCT